MAGGLPSQARYDDGAPGGRGCGGARDAGMDASPGMVMGGKAPWPPVPLMAVLSFLALAAGVAIAFVLRAT